MVDSNEGIEYVRLGDRREIGLQRYKTEEEALCLKELHSSVIITRPDPSDVAKYGMSGIGGVVRGYDAVDKVCFCLCLAQAAQGIVFNLTYRGSCASAST